MATNMTNLTGPVALLGDTHENRTWTLAILEEAYQAGITYVISQGDFGYWPNQQGQWSYGVVVSNFLREHSMYLWFLDGNHEHHDKLSCLPLDPTTGRRPVTDRIHHLPRGHRWTVDGHEWMAVGGAASVDKQWRREGVDWFSAETITDDDVATAVEGGPVTVLLTHDAPQSPALENFLSQNGMKLPAEARARALASQEQVERIVAGVKPTLLVHGHYHHRYSGSYGDTTVMGLSCDGASSSDAMVFINGDGTPSYSFAS